MKKSLTTILIAILFVTGCSAQNSAQGIKDAFYYNRFLAKTVSMGNALEAPVEGDWGMKIEKEYFKLIKDAGFTAVRVPIKWSAHALENAPFTVDKSFFERIDEVLSQALEQDLAVILDFHHYWELDAEPEKHLQRWLKIWAQISKHYQSSPSNVFFEILNEPHDKINDAIWNNFLLKGITEIRKTNPTRILIVGPTYWNAAWKLKDLRLPSDDRNIIATFHYYDPFDFTHQGAEWVEPSPPLGVEWHEDDFSFASGWEDWSWDTSFKASGDTLELNFDKGWAGLYLHSNSALSGFESLRFSTNKALKLSILCVEDETKAFRLDTSNATASYTIDLRDCGTTNALDRIIIQNYSDEPQTIAISDLRLVAKNKELKLTTTIAEQMKTSFESVSEWARAHNRPLFMGEFGAYSKADLKSRIRWTSFVRKTAEEYNISWSYWEFGSGFAVYNRNTKSWNKGILNALIPK